ncbi:MAG: EamA family transporter [Alphaproteobacteria bacterium]|nr:EamA family transporter [Alphaproteobacteria bacterium]
MSAASPTSQHTSSIVGALWMLGAVCSFTTLTLSGRELSGEMNAFQIMLYRSGISLIIIIAILARGGVGETGFGQLRTSIPLVHLGRSLVHYAGQYSFFFVLPLLPLVQITTLEFSFPIWTILLAAVFLNERLTHHRIAAVLFGFAGIVVVMRPGVMEVELASLIMLGAAFCYATAFVITKWMTGTEKPHTILFYMFFIQLLVGLAPALPGFVVPDPEKWPWVVAVGVAGLVAHYCVARAFMATQASAVMPLDFLRLPLIGLAGWWLYGEGVDIWLIIGAGLILFGIWINSRSR